MAKKNAPSFFWLGFAVLISSCSACWDPIYYGETATNPGKPWDPAYSEWYCPRVEPPSSLNELILPDKNSEVNIVELLDIALRNQPLTRLAWAQARAQAFLVGAVDSNYYPVLTGTESLVFNDIHSAGALGSATSGSNIVDAEQGTGASDMVGFNSVGYTQSVVSDLSIYYLLWDFGGREALSKSARYALFSLNWTHNRVIQEVIFNVIEGYYNYINAKETLIARKSDLENAELSYKAAEAQFESGIVTRLDVLQAKSNQENAILAVITAQSQIKIALGALATALGIPPSTEFETRNFPERFPVEEMAEGVEALMDLAKKNRPDLASAQATILQKQNDVRVAISSSLPTLTTNVTLEKTTFLNNTGQDNRFYSGVISLNIPIFSGFLYENQIREARENVRAAEANFDNVEAMALLDVVTSYYNFISAKESLKYSQEYLKTTQEAYDLALGIYKAGTGNLLNVLTAQASLSDAKSLNIQSRTQWAISTFNIAYATGTLNASFVGTELATPNENEGNNEALHE